MKATCEELKQFIQSDSRFASAFLAWQQDQECYKAIFDTQYVFKLSEVSRRLRLGPSTIKHRCAVLGIPKRAGHWLFTREDVERLESWKGGAHAEP